MRRPITVWILSLAWAAVAAVPATAEPPGVNGQIAYSRFQPGVGFWEFDAMTANPDGSHEQLFRSDTQGLQWSPDGGQAFVNTDAADGRITIAILNADGTGYREFPLPDATLNLGAGAWTPDGTRLLLDGWDDHEAARNGMYSIRASDFGDLVQVTTSPFGGHDAPADYSPDGTRILFTREFPDKGQGEHALFVSRSDGTEARRITPWGLESSYMAGWSPDGNRIVFDGGGSIYLARPDGSDLAKIAIAQGGERRYAFNVGWAPDGTRLGFTLCLRKAQRCDVYTMRPDGSHVQQVTDTPEFEEFSDWGTHPIVD